MTGSSSSDAAKVPAKGALATEELTRMPLSQCIALDKLSSTRWVLTNLETCEQALLSDFTCCEIVEQGSFAMVALVDMDGDAQVKDVDALFSKFVYVDSSGDRVIGPWFSQKEWL